MSNIVYVTMTILVASGIAVDDSTVLTDCMTEPKFPPENTYMCYRTQIERIGPFQACTTERNRFRNITVFSQSPNYTIMYINTPGKNQGRTYTNQLLCRWYIKCPKNQLLYYDIIEHNLEPKVMSPFFSEPVCVDYLKLYRDFGTEISCGFRGPTGDIEPNKLYIEFRSNTKLRFPGFRMRLVCFDPALQGEGGCFLSASPARFKKSMSQLQEQYFTSSYVNPFDDSYYLTRVRRETTIQKRIPTDASIRFQSGYLQVFPEYIANLPIKYLIVYNEKEGVKVIQTSNSSVILRGFGALTIANNVAYYTTFGTDPKYKPNEKEEELIRNVLEAQEILLRNSTAIGDSSDLSSLDQTGKRKRQTIIAAPHIPVNTVLSSKNSCNAILKSVALSYFQLVSSDLQLTDD